MFITISTIIAVHGTLFLHTPKTWFLRWEAPLDDAFSSGPDKMWPRGHDVVSRARTLWANERLREPDWDRLSAPECARVSQRESQREAEWVRESKSEPEWTRERNVKIWYILSRKCRGGPTLQFFPPCFPYLSIVTDTRWKNQVEWNVFDNSSTYFFPKLKWSAVKIALKKLSLWLKHQTSRKNSLLLPLSLVW